MDASNNWCCKLTGTVGSSSGKKTIQGFGVIVQFDGDLSTTSQLPGLMKAGEITSKYALLTCHSIIPGSEESLRRITWSLNSKATGSTKYPKLNEFVSGAVSCCGEKSLFGPGEYTLTEHQGEVCALGLDFTLLFLNSKFESYITSNPLKCSLPLVTIPQGEVHRKKLSEAIRITAQKKPGTFFISLPAVDTDTTTKSCSGSSCMQITAKSAKGFSSLSLSIDSQKKVLKLYQDIAKYEAVKCIACKFIRDDPAISPFPGMPIAYQPASSGATAELTGILVQSSQGLIGISVYGIAQLIQGGPIGCLSVLINEAADRLWANRWSYLILPYLEQPVPLDTRHVLEILQVFLEKKLLKANKTDFLKTREAVLTLTGAVFCHFKDLSQKNLRKAIEDAFGDSTLKREFFGNLESLCKSVVENVNDANRYRNIRILSQQDTTQFVQACFYAVARMLNFNSQEGIVSRELKNDDFLRTLHALGEKYKETATVQRDLASIHDKCLSDLQRNVEVLTTTHKQDIEKLQSEHAERIKQLEDSYSKEKERLVQSQEICTKYSNLVKLERAKSCSFLEENKKLKENNQDLQQRLSSERDLREQLQTLTCEVQRLTCELEEKTTEIEEKSRTISVLDERCKTQSASAHRINLELSQSHETIHTQTKLLAENKQKIEQLEKEKDVQTKVLEKKVDDLQKQNKELVTQHEQKDDRTKELERKVDDLQKQNEELVSQLDKTATRQAKPHLTGRHSLQTYTPPGKHKKVSVPTPVKGTASSSDHMRQPRKRTSLSETSDEAKASSTRPTRPMSDYGSRKTKPRPDSTVAKQLQFNKKK